MALGVPRLPFSLDPLIAKARRRARRRQLLLAGVALLIAGGALGAAFALRSSDGSGGATVALRRLSAVGSECGSGVSGRGFRVFACESGGARTGHPHPKELLVLRADGSSVAYPGFRVGEPVKGNGEVVATYDIGLVQVTRGGIVPLLTTDGLARSLHVRTTAIVDIYAPRIDTRGDVYFVASTLPGCRNRVLERTAAAAIRQIRVLASRNGTCS